MLVVAQVSGWQQSSLVHLSALVLLFLLHIVEASLGFSPAKQVWPLKLVPHVSGVQQVSASQPLAKQPGGAVWHRILVPWCLTFATLDFFACALEFQKRPPFRSPAVLCTSALHWDAEVHSKQPCGYRSESIDMMKCIFSLGAAAIHAASLLNLSDPMPQEIAPVSENLKSATELNTFAAQEPTHSLSVWVLSHGFLSQH